MKDALAADPWHAYYDAPAWLSALIAKGALGQKTKGGIFVKKGKEIHVLDLAKQDYRPSAGAVAEEVQAILKEKSPAEQFAKLRASAHPQAKFLWAIYRDLFHYCAVHLADIAHCAGDVDFAIRWGFGWARGPFEIWQAAGWKQVAAWIAEDIAAGKTNRGRQDDGEGAAARVGHGRARRRAFPRRLLERRRRHDAPAFLAARLREAGLAGTRAG